MHQIRDVLDFIRSVARKVNRTSEEVVSPFGKLFSALHQVASQFLLGQDERVQVSLKSNNQLLLDTRQCRQGHDLIFLLKMHLFPFSNQFIDL